MGPNSVRNAAVAVATIALAAILGALAFQHLGGLPPCPLCLEQRWAYYLGVPAAVLAAGLAHAGSSRPARALLALVALAFLANAVLGAYHAGVEWQLWRGPQDCSGASLGELGTGDLRDRLRESRVVRCDEAAWRLMGLSLAGYNALISAALAAIAAAGALKRPGIPGVIRQESSHGSSSVSQ